MAANAVMLRAMLQNIGFQQDAATYIVDTQGFDNAQDYADMTNSDIENICKITRRPGGQNAANNGPNNGISVSMKAEKNLKMVAFYYRYQIRTSRPLIINNATPNNITRFRMLMEAEDQHKDMTPPELTFVNWTRTIDVIEDYLRNCLGKTKIPLAYIIRDQERPEDPNLDPPGNYSSFTEELIARAPHYVGATDEHTQEYKEDNVIVYNKLAALLREKDCWTYMRSAMRTRDGRKAFKNLKDHYLGKNNVDHLASQAERKLQHTSYTNEGRRWNFEKYVRVHVEQHQILTELKDHGYSGIDERSKVRYLLEGINTTALDTVKTQILSSADLRNDFGAAVNLFQDFLKQTKTTKDPRTSNVSSIGRTTHSKSGKNNNSSEVDMSVEDRYYTPQEYAKLSVAKKNGLRAKRKKRGHSSDNESGKSNKRQQRANKKFEKRVVSAIRRISLKDDKDDSSDSDSSRSNDEPTQAGNKSILRRREE